MRWWLVWCLVAPCSAQDVFLGGRVDLELQLGGETRFDFGRLAGIDLTYSQPGVLDAFVNLSVAGGDPHLAELYLSLPQTRRICDVVVGRFRAPFGDRETDPTDRYAVGARDLFTTYDGWRMGNVYLDSELTGVLLHRELGPLALDAAGGTTSDNDQLAYAGRIEIGDRLRGGGSLFFGSDAAGESYTQAALHGGWSGRRATVTGQLYLGQAAGGDFRGWLYRGAYRLPGAPVELHLAQTLYNEDLAGPVTTTRLGATARLGEYYRAEARMEWRDAPAPFDDELFLLRLLAIF